MTTYEGGCQCGAVRYKIEGEISPVTACHCSQCRRTSGHFWAAFHAPHDGFTLTEERGLTWFTSSDWAKRGFCNQCGASLFYQMTGEATINVAAGSLDQPTGLHMKRHIFVADKGDYYDITDDLPQIDTF